MDNLIDITISLCLLLVVLFTVGVWTFEILAILRSQKEQDHFRRNPWYAWLAFLSSPAVLLLHICAHLFAKISRLIRFILLSLLILLALLVSPAFLLGIPFAYLIFRLFQAAAPLGGRVFHLSMDFFDRLNFRIEGREQERIT